MQLTCRNPWCRQSFEITQEDLAFYKKVSPVFNKKKYDIPPPTLCPACRMQRRFAYRNERSLHHRTCDLTGKSIITFYRPDASFKVYDKDVWWSDAWDALKYGASLDFSRTFFAQFAELQRSVPRLGMVVTQDEGSAYCSYCTSVKNSYMCTSCVVNEDCYYCYQANESQDCADSTNVTQCERCLECIECFGLHSCAFCQDCENGNDLLFCQDCRGCSDCIGCKNLVGKRHWILNRQATPEECAALRSSFASHTALRSFEQKFLETARALPSRASHLTNCENSTGDHLRNCRNAKNCFNCVNLEDCQNLCPIPGLGTKDCRDAHYSPGAELVYDSMSGMRCTHTRFVLHCWDDEDILYCDECFSSKHLFGCVGLRHKEYCILNKQYAREEYEKIVPKIIEHMQSSGEYGEYFPITLSPFAYNDSIASDEFPLKRDKALQRGWRWEDHEEDPPSVAKVVPAQNIPDNITDMTEDLADSAILCAETQRPFRVIRKELAFYRSMELPVPRLHPDERYRKRLTRKNPRKLWDRQCAKCHKPIATSYAPNRPEIVYCEECYLREVY